MVETSKRINQKVCNEDINKLFVLLLRKGNYPYEYVDSWERFNETSLPDKKAFYIKLNLEDITDKDYAHAQKVFKKFKLKNLGSYHDLNVRSDNYCLQMCLKILETSVLKYMNPILLIFCQHLDQHGSSNINEVIRAVLNSLLLFFFTKRFRAKKRKQKKEKSPHNINVLNTEVPTALFM